MYGQSDLQGSWFEAMLFSKSNLENDGRVERKQ
jgi:hypothetical protein